MGHLNGFAFLLALTTESQNLFDHVTGMFAGVKNFFQILSDICIHLCVHQYQLGITDNDRKNIIKIVRDPAGKRSNRLHLLSLLKLIFKVFLFLFCPLSFRDVMRDDHCTCRFPIGGTNDF